ncbi:MAG TPA: hypothetical protein VJP85_03705, partial [Candidatus Baltobacteraceae bacterium]|nr:hypothetical protein [Candidatus Baltobacteraceae bacterium]
LSDVHTGNVSQLLLDGWLSTGDVEGHLRRSRTAYRDRLEAALREVRDDGSLQLYCEPRGGYHLFCRLPAPLTSAAVRARCAAAGIYFLCGDLFAADGTLDDYLRLCVSSLPPPAIQVGLRRLSHVVRELMVASR